MLPVLFYVAASLAAPAAGPPAMVVWLSPTTPDATVTAAAEKEVGSAKHVSWSEIALTPEPFAGSDEQRLTSLSSVMKDGMAQWDEFDAEASVARALAAAVEPVELVRNEADRNALLSALLWEGAGITRTFPENLFASLQDTVPFRVTVASKSMVKPWLHAISLDPQHVFARSEFPDGQSYARVQAMQSELALLPPGRLVIDPLPPGATAVLNGVAIPAERREVELVPGHHYVHVVSGDQVFDRMEFDVAPSDTVKLPIPVSPEELSTAAQVVLGGSAAIAPDVAAAIRSAAGRSATPPRVFLATTDERGRAKLVAFSGGAVIAKKRPVTVLFNGELGGGVLQSSGFAGGKGEESTTFQFGGLLGFELGIYNFVILGGADMALSPMAQMAYGVEGGTTPEENEETSAYFRPRGGVGVYLPRPSPGKVWFLLAGNYGWMSPSNSGPGVQLSLGLPLKDGQTWVRLTVDGYRGTQAEGFPAEGTPTSAASFRVGFGSLL